MEFLELLTHWAATERIAAIDPDGARLSYAELERRSDALAADWMASLPKGAAVIIRGDKENDIVTCMFAGLKSGHPYAFVPDYFPEKKVQSIVNASNAALLISLCGIPEFDCGTEVIDQAAVDAVCARPFTPARAEVGIDDMVCVFFTSGSTGNPKGVMLTRGNIECMEEWWTGATQAVPDAARILNFSPYTFSASLVTIYSYMLRHGGTLNSVSRATSQDFQKLMELIFRVDPNCLDCTPSFIDLCMQNEAFGNSTLPSMRLISVGGEALSRRIAATMLQRFPLADIVNGYGATETTAGAIDCKVTEDMLNTDGPLPIGYIAKGSIVRVVDENRVPVPDGTNGEMVIISGVVSLGYMGEPEKTARSFFVDEETGLRGYYTGDVVRKDADGLITYIGRTNNMVKIGGYRVELEEVELRLNAVEGVVKGVVVPVYEEDRATMMTAFVQLAADCPKGLPTFARIKRTMKETLPDYMVPSKILFVEAFPKNNNDKLDRNALVEQVRVK